MQHGRMAERSRRWFKAPVTSVARVRISLLSHIGHGHNNRSDRWLDSRRRILSCATISALELHANTDLTMCHGRMAEWSKALVLGTSHFGGAGSNPASVIIR